MAGKGKEPKLYVFLLQVKIVGNMSTSGQEDKKEGGGFRFLGLIPS